jgi:hypothetical protein
MAPLPFADLLGWSPPPWAVVADFGFLLVWIFGVSRALGRLWGVPEALPFRPAAADVALRSMKWSALTAASLFLAAIAALFALAPWFASSAAGPEPAAPKARTLG